MQNIDAETSAQVNQKNSPFLSLPTEIQELIVIHAITHNEPLRPFLGTHRIDRRDGISMSQPHLPNAIIAASNLAITCKTTNDLVMGNRFLLLYTVNTFEFIHPLHVMKYLSGAHTERRNTIKSIIIHYVWHDPTINKAFEALAACGNLQHLALDITSSAKFFNPGGDPPTRAPGYSELAKLRGLRTLTLESYKEEHSNFISATLETYRMTEVTEETKKELCEEVEAFRRDLEALVTRSKLKVTVAVAAT